MKKFKIAIEEHVVRTFDVIADSDKEAIETAEKSIMMDHLFLNLAKYQQD